MTAGDINDDFYDALILGGYSNIRTEFDESTATQIGLFEGSGQIDCVSSSNGLGGSDITKSMMQVQVRDADKATARGRALAIIALLHRATMAGCLSVFWNGRIDHWRDDNNRSIYSIEFNVIRTAGLVG
jgi:hypothetical protein